MKVKIKFNKNSEYFKHGDKTEIIDDIIEIHYNFNSSGRIAFECKYTGGTYLIKDIEEFELKHQE